MVKDVLIVSIFIFVLCVLFVPPDRGGGWLGWLRVGSEERVKWSGSGEREESQKILLMGNLGYQKFLLTGIKPFLKVSLHELSICNYGKRYLFHQKTMEKGILFSFKYYGNYGKVILKVGGHPVLCKTNQSNIHSIS